MFSVLPLGRVEQLARRAAAEGVVLLKNEGGLLPLAAGSRLALFGAGASKTIKGGTGSGDVNERGSVSIWQGLADAGYQITTETWLRGYDETYAQARQEWKQVILQDAKKLEAEGLGKADKFIAAAKNYAPFDYMQTDNPDVLFKAEGFIYPATYELPVGLSEEKILAILVGQFDEYMREEKIPEKCAQQGLQLRQVVNLAAMVELEAVFAEEQPRIAGVFLKRLAIGMPIQSDTTIQYLLGSQKEIITFDDTKIQSPYNTYQNPGLPPGPIGSPGMSAIKAVLEPEKTEYLYFVAEKDGHHRFTKTYSEHLRAIREIG